MSTKPKLLCIHYNGNSTGSFVDSALERLKLLEQEFDVEFLVASDGTFTQQLRETGAKVAIGRLHELSLKVHRWLPSAMKFWWNLRRKRIEIIYVMDFVHWKPIELRIASRSRIPIVAFCGFYKPPIFANSFLKSVDTIVTNSNHSRDNIAGGEFAEKTKVIYNSIDLKKYQRHSAPSQHLGTKRPPTIGFAGTLLEIKGIDDLINALPSIIDVVPNVRVKIAGEARGESNYKQTLIDLVEQMNLMEHVEFVGHISDISDFMSQIDVLAVPSHDEPFGYVNIEAGAAGVPVIASSVGGIPEIVIQNTTGLLVPARSSEDLAKASIELLTNPAKAQKMGSAARARITGEFSSEKQLPKWTILLKNALRRNQV